MTERQGEGGARSWFASTPFRIGGIAVLLVLAEIAARARAAGELPHVVGPSGGLVIGIIRTLGVGVLASGLVLLLWGRRINRLKIAAGRPGKRQLDQAQRKRLVIAVMIGFLVAVAYQIVLQLLGPPEPRKGQPSQDQPPVQQNGNGWIDQTQAHAPGEAGIGTYLTGIVLLMALTALAVVLLRRTQLVEYEEADDEDEDVEAVARAVVAGRAAVRDRAITDPRAAIVACFAAMEQALAGVGSDTAPRAADTPSEVLRRGAQGSALPEAPSGRLLELFQEARFSTHPMLESDRAAADEALAAILTSLGVPQGIRR